MNRMTLALLAFVVLHASSASAQSIPKTFSRELLEQQRLMNSTLPPKAPFIPETGRFNYETLIYGHYRLEDQWAELDRMRRTFAEPKTKRLDEYLAAGLKTINRHKAAVDGFRGADFIAEREVSALQELEYKALNSVTLAFLEAQRLTLQEQGEMLEPQALVKSIGIVSPTPHVKDSFIRQAQGLRQRADRLQATVEVLQGRLEDAATGDFNSSHAAVKQSMDEIAALDKDLRRFMEALGFRLHIR